MPIKLSMGPGFSDGLSGALQSHVHSGSSLHDGLMGQLLGSGLDGSLARVVSVSVLLAAGAIFARRSPLVDRRANPPA